MGRLALAVAGRRVDGVGGVVDVEDRRGAGARDAQDQQEDDEDGGERREDDESLARPGLVSVEPPSLP